MAIRRTPGAYKEVKRYGVTTSTYSSGGNGDSSNSGPDKEMEE